MNKVRKETCRFLFTIKGTIKCTKSVVIHFWLILSFCISWKHQKTKGFLVFLGGIKWEHFIGSIMVHVQIRHKFITKLQFSIIKFEFFKGLVLYNEVFMDNNFWKFCLYCGYIFAQLFLREILYAWERGESWRLSKVFIFSNLQKEKQQHISIIFLNMRKDTFNWILTTQPTFTGFKSTRRICEVCSKLTVKTLERVVLS